MEGSFKLTAGAIILSATAVAFSLTFGIRKVVLDHAKPAAKPVPSLVADVPFATVPESGTIKSAANGNIVATEDVYCDTSGQHCDPVSESVAKVMERRFGKLDEYSASTVWVNGEYSQYGVTKYTRALNRLRKVELWAEGLPPGNTRSAYLAVTGFYEDGAQASLNEIQNRHEQQRMAEYDRKQKECDRAAREYRASHKLPEPPQ